MTQKFTKNDSRINKSGRPAGSQNKLTKELREALKAVISDEIQALPAYLRKLDDKERVDALIKLMQFVLPKLDTINAFSGEALDWT